jgi:hypothetical protein
MINPLEPDETPVLFRIDPDDPSNPVAVFPTLPGSVQDRYSMTCYAHVGQHSACTMGWYDLTRPAKPEEYAELRAELESKPFEYRLRVYRRITAKHRKELAEAASL